MFLEANIGDVFLKKTDGQKIPFLKTEESKAANLFTREVGDFDPDCDIAVVSTDVLAVLIHGEEIRTWVDQAKAFYIQKDEEQKPF